MVAFNEIPSTLRIPFVAVEFDSSAASKGPALLNYRALILGQKRDDAGTAEANKLYRVSNPDQVIKLAGMGSMLHRQAIAHFASNKITETWIGVLEDDDGGQPADGTITVDDADPSLPGAESGTIALYMGGVRLSIGVQEGDTADEIATAIAAAINARLDLPVTADVTGNIVTVTFRHTGEVGNGYDMRDSYRDGEKLPEGITVAYDPLAGGTSNPDLANIIAELGDRWFNVIAHPYTDATSLSAIEAELVSRFGPMRQIDGEAITSAVGTLGDLATLGESRNSPHSSIVSQAGINPVTPAFEYGAETAAVVAREGTKDPARPFQTLALVNALPIPEGDLFSNEERNQLLFSGIATSTSIVSQPVQLERLITTYRKSAANADDTAYLDVTTMLTLMYLRYSFRTRMKNKYPRHKLGNDGVRTGAGQKVMTPKLGKGEALGWFHDMEDLVLVEGFDQFKADLVVERSNTDPNRLEFLLPPDLINQLIVMAAQIQFRR